MVLTLHARERVSQRGIPLEAIEYTVRHGARYHRTGIVFHVLRRRDLRRLDVRDQRILKWEGTTVLVDRGEVISVYRNRDVARIRRKGKRDESERLRQRRSPGPTSLVGPAGGMTTRT